MDVLYIPQLDEIGTGGGGDSGGEGGGGSGGTAARYRILRRVPEDGVVVLTDRAVTRVDIATDGGPLRLVVPPEAKGTARDFFVRLVITADEIPEVTFAAPAGETISFEDVDDDVFKCETGVNVFAFTELDGGIFIVNRKMVDIDMEVEFDPCGGDLDVTSATFKLGAQYSTLPKPTMAGHTFAGWFTEAEDGVKVEATEVWSKPERIREIHGCQRQYASELGTGKAATDRCGTRPFDHSISETSAFPRNTERKLPRTSTLMK